MRGLDVAYSSEVDTLDDEMWYRLLGQFEDANIYQTWAYGLVRNGRQNISHLVLKDQDRVVAIAQCRIMKAPIIGAGIAYVMWGPLWRTRGGQTNVEVFRQAIRALRNEYALRRGLLLRIYPCCFEDEARYFMPILNEEGFGRVNDDKSARTILMDVTPSLDDLRKRLRPHWQRELKVAEKHKLEILEGVHDELFEQFIVMYKEMVARKKFLEPNDISEFRTIQSLLPDDFKMRIMLCRSSEGICAGLISSAIGGTAIYLFGATSGAGMKSRGSYLLQWKFIDWLQQQFVPQYDLNGINPETNAGTYKFKNDLAGEHGKDVRFLGRFESCESVVSYACANVGERLRSLGRVLKKA